MTDNHTHISTSILGTKVNVFRIWGKIKSGTNRQLTIYSIHI